MPTPRTAPCLAGDAAIAHGFFTRAGGASCGVYDSLNCGFGSQDDREAVQGNRRAVARVLGSAFDDIVTPFQVHSANAVFADRPFDAAPGTPPKADAIVTATPGLAVGINTADCGPVLFADTENGVVAAAHAGWKGALGGVLAATVAEMERNGARREAILAVLGPTISQSSYEVGADFRDRFVAEAPGSERFFDDTRPRPHFDLPGFIADRLSALGLAKVGDLGLCTYRGASEFFSYRRATHNNEADYGRQISAIVLK